MPEDGTDDEKFYRFIREMLNEAAKNGKFPGGDFSITIAGGRIPIDIIPSDSSGRVLPGGEGPGIRDEKPHTEVQMVGDTIIISADLPGASNTDMAIAVEEGFVTITALTENVRYSARVKVPPMKKETLKYSFNNGLLEISAEAT